MKFTKHHNHVARKNLLKIRKAKIASGQGSAGKAQKQVARQTTTKGQTWSLASLVKTVTNYFSGESAKPVPKKRTKRTHPKKKAAKQATTTAKPVAAAKK